MQMDKNDEDYVAVKPVKQSESILAKWFMSEEEKQLEDISKYYEELFKG